MPLPEDLVIYAEVRAIEFRMLHFKFIRYLGRRAGSSHKLCDGTPSSIFRHLMPPASVWQQIYHFKGWLSRLDTWVTAFEHLLPLWEQAKVFRLVADHLTSRNHMETHAAR